MTVQDLSQHGARLAIILISLLPRHVRAQTTPRLDPVAVRAALVPRVNDGTFRGIATAWSEGDEIRAAAAGVTTPHGAAIGEATRFELGEAAEVFTAALLANLVASGEVSLNDQAQRFLPADVKLPTRNGRAMTLGDLGLHRSGLPDVSVVAAESPTERVVRSLSGVGLRSDIGTRYVYSRLGMEILGLALARHLRMPLATAIQLRLISPLGLSGIAPSFEPRVAATDAVGHQADGQAATGARRTPGSWRATVVAMTRFAIATSDTIRGPLASTFALMMRTRSLGPDPTLPVALGWRVLRLDGRDIYWHDAQQAPGFSAYVVVDPVRHRSAAVLSNTARDVDAIAGALLLGRVPRIASASRAVPRRRPGPARSRARRGGRR